MKEKAYQIALDELYEKSQSNYYDEIEKKYYVIYDNINDDKILNIFAFLHNRFNRIFTELNRRYKNRVLENSSIHCTADHNRKLI